MDIKEAYVKLQASWVKLWNVKKGTRVKILRTNKSREFGADCASHIESELKAQGNMGIVDIIEEHRIWVKMHKGYDWVLPFFVLEVLETEPENMITVAGKEYSESTLAKAIKEYVK